MVIVTSRTCHMHNLHTRLPSFLVQVIYYSIIRKHNMVRRAQMFVYKDVFNACSHNIANIIILQFGWVYLNVRDNRVMDAS